MKPVTRTFFETLARAGRLKLLGTLMLMVAFSMTEGIGIALLLPTLQVAGLDLAGQGEAGRYAGWVTRGFLAIGLRPSLSLLLGVFVILAGARTMLGQVQSLAMYRVQQDFQHQLRLRLYHAIANASWLFVCRSRASDFTHAITSEIDRVGLAVWVVLLMAGDLVLVVLYLAIAFALSPGMTALVLGFGAILSFAFHGRTRMVEQTGEEVSDTTKSLYAATIEHLQSLKAAKTYGAQASNFAIFSDLSAGAAEASIQAVREQAIAAGYFEFGSVLILAIAIYASIRVLAVPPAAILILLLLFARLMPRLMSAQQHYRGFVNSIPSFANVIDIEARCVAAAEPTAHPLGRLELNRELEAENVSFSYGDGRAPAVHQLDLAIPAGKIVALVGPSGAGKSTIADILMGLISPDAGTLKLDGKVLGPDSVRGWRDQIGYVAPDTFLFHDTIRANLKWARADAGEDEMREALELAAADDFVAGLEHGLDTVVGDRGILISQGERQRLALARAFLRRPALMILDEATNSLDSENEARVMAAIEHRRGALTVVIIAHRLSTVRWADLIFVVEGGTIVESGDWSELSTKSDGRFRALWEAQSLTV